MHHPPLRPPRRQAGVSLIEIMIGLTIALITTLMLSQIMGLWWDQRKTTDSASEGQNHGLTSLVLLEQAIRSAGYGTQNLLFTCETRYSYKKDASGAGVDTSFSGTTEVASSLSFFTMEDGGTDGESDTLFINRGKGNFSYGYTTLSADMPQPSSELKVTSTQGIAEGDLVVVIDPDSSPVKCTRMDITQVQVNAGTGHLQHNPGQGDEITYNPTVDYQNDNSWPAYHTGDLVIKLGEDIYSDSYYVSNNKLIFDRNALKSAASQETLSENIINIQAQYGVKDTCSGSDCFTWHSASETGYSQDDINDSLDKIKSIQAVKLAVVARIPKRESNIVTQACTGFSKGICIWSNHQVRLDEGSNTDEWQHYKYRVYESIIPLRNAIWLASST